MALPTSASAPSSPSNTPAALPMGTQSPASSPVMILLAEPGLRIRHIRPSRLHRPHGADGVTLVNVHGVPASSGPGCGEFGVGSWEGGETVDVSQFRRLG
ncbi:hypothetical protein QIS74_13093 [Colletotrichum tabaci]|uniref:Uncharacterized protein n=1 Tax=Colletotrichum tabaci TaxID=1209068 RepID=A0AAV9SYD0_9PEZI